MDNVDDHDVIIIDFGQDGGFDLLIESHRQQ